MPLFPEARAVIALGWDCEMIGDYADTNATGVTHGHLDDRVIEHMLGLATVAEQADFRLQYFILGQTLEQPVDFLRDLQSRGHALDQHTYDHLSLISENQEGVRRQIAHTNELFEQHLGFRPMGVRAPGGYAQALYDHPQTQAMLKSEGLQFVSSHYATKSPSGKYDVYADKNAHQIMKHHQPRWYDSGLLEIPITGYSDRHFFDLLQRPLDKWITHLQECVDFAYDMGGLLYAPALHPDTHSRHDPGMETLPALIEYASKKMEPVKFVTYREVAEAALGA